MEHISTHDDVARYEAEQDAVMDAQFLIQDLLDERKLNRREAARLLGVSPARLSQLMRADANPTIRTLAGILQVLGGTLSVARKNDRIATHTDMRCIAEAHWAHETFDHVAPMKKPSYDFRRLLDGANKRLATNNDNNAAPIEGQHSQTVAA
jgi:transcriptional regulator with XRE-family HTH domain